VDTRPPLARRIQWKPPSANTMSRPSGMAWGVLMRNPASRAGTDCPLLFGAGAFPPPTIFLNHHRPPCSGFFQTFLTVAPSEK
jgi:hypothetical protein